MKGSASMTTFIGLRNTFRKRQSVETVITSTSGDSFVLVIYRDITFVVFASVMKDMKTPV